MILRAITKWSALICILSVQALHGHPLENIFESEILKMLDTGKTSSYLKNFAEEFELHKLLSYEEFNTDSWPDAKRSAFCIACATTANIGLRSNDTTFIINSAIQICLNLNLGNDVVCTGMVNSNAPAVFYMVKTYPDQLSGRDMCGFIFESNGCTTDNPDRIWEVEMPSVQKPALVQEPSFPSADSVPTYKVLHLSDTHVDPDYLIGSNAVCDEEYFCCRAESGPVAQPGDAAGQWGDYRACDLPVWTLEAMYKHISETDPDIDFILWTGDVIPHIDWETNKTSTIDILQQMTDLLIQYFPGVPVYPALGNHDSDVVNQFSQPYIEDPEFNMAWLYVPLVTMWDPWLPLSTNADLAVYGSYNMLIKPGLRLISVNTNFCQSINWWSLIDSNDGGDELYRLAQSLQAAEFTGESVFIIQHIAPGSCFHVYSHQYNLIIARYEATITGMFFGHSHHDHFKLFFDPDDDSRVFDIGYIGQSQTTYKNLNPGYKIYTIEGQFQDSEYRVLDHANYYFPLDTANANNETDIIFLYSAKDDYSLPDLSPQSWLDFVYLMNEPNNPEFVDFHRNYAKNGPDAMDCDDDCKHGTLCSLLSTDSTAGPCRLNFTTSGFN